MKKDKDVVKKRNKTKILVSILLLLIVIAIGILIVKNDQKNKIKNDNIAKNNFNNVVENKNPKSTPKPKPKTMQGKERPIAFMLDNNINATPQAGLEQADIIYEMIVEGGESRLMAVIKNKKIDKIGPLRSARHYFLDYALENDAIYLHYGQSPQAEDDIKKLAVNNINGIYGGKNDFWRDKTRYAPHNAVTSTEKLNNMIERKQYRTTSSQKNLLNYVVEEINLDKEEKLEEGQTTKVLEANIVNIPYSPHNKVKYVYDEESKEYIRYSRGKKQTDWNTENDVKTKNIIITKCKNSTLDDGSGKGRQTLYNIKTLDGYYITNGKAIPIQCEKRTRKDQTKYLTLNGQEIKVNDGKTFIQICPDDSEITFE